MFFIILAIQNGFLPDNEHFEFIMIANVLIFSSNPAVIGVMSEAAASATPAILKTVAKDTF